jgi:hypothetical protein
MAPHTKALRRRILVCHHEQLKTPGEMEAGKRSRDAWERDG